MRYLKRILNERELKCEILLYKIFMFKFILNLYDIELFCRLYLFLFNFVVINFSIKFFLVLL